MRGKPPNRRFHQFSCWLSLTTIFALIPRVWKIANTNVNQWRANLGKEFCCVEQQMIERLMPEIHYQMIHLGLQDV